MHEGLPGCSNNPLCYSMEKAFISVIIRLLSILFFLACFSLTHVLAIGNNHTDYGSLLAFKNDFLKLSGGASSAIFMSSWNSSYHFCSWEGVSCGRKHQDRVTGLDLSSSGLMGPLPPSIANFTFLRMLDLSNNSLYGEISPNLSNLRRLQHLNLSFNSFYGDIPATLMTNNSVIQVLDLRSNQLEGKIPPVNNIMSPLKYLNLFNNHIIGSIPPSLGNLSFLETLHILYNNLEGGIPPEIGGLHKIKIFNVADNNLSGNIPSSFYNLSSLLGISLTNNHLSGDISTNIAQAFPHLKQFFIGGNNFIGSLYHVFRNVTSLVELGVSTNNFTGVVPQNLGKMHNLKYLNMEENQLEARDVKDWRFIDSLANCSNLELLSLYGNNLGGMLPKSMGNLSTELQLIYLGSNHIFGSISFQLNRYTKLICLAIGDNLLEGEIPESIGKLGMLQVLDFSGNSIGGIIPDSLGNLTKLYKLKLEFNKLTGTIPLSIKNLHLLNYLDLSHNSLIDLIPKELFLISSFSINLDLSYNSFTGTLPLEVGNLINIMSLDLSNNHLIGEIPESLGSCQLLLELYIEGNFIQGPIPISLGKIHSLEILDLSNNNLSGSIPQSLENLILLMYLNLSFNNLEGEVPYKGVFANSSAISLIGNEKICGGIPRLYLRRCVDASSSTKSYNHNLIKILAPILSMLVALLVSLLCCTWLYTKQRKKGRKRNSSESSLSTPFQRISYAKLAKATNGFSTSNLLGFGRYGSVYRGILEDYQATVAIKVFNLEVHGAFKSFTSECDALRGIRHRNLVSVLTTCSSIDHQGRDFKALIFEFMPKGNLDMWLHQDYERDGDYVLSLEIRLNIVINVADALEYLHHNCEPSIIHCDIKPSNILLDNNMIAYIGDFGLSKILSEAVSISFQDYSSKSEIKGTIGYVAPEYGGGARPSTAADVYSFGIILLEMLIGRRPTDDIYKDNLNLYNHVKMAFPHKINNIIDLKMFSKEEREASMSDCQNINKCLISLAEVGIACSTSFAEERPCMRDVARKLHTIRISYLQSDGN